MTPRDLLPPTRTVAQHAVIYLLLCADVGREQAVCEHPSAGLAVVLACLKSQRSLLPETSCDRPLA